MLKWTASVGGYNSGQKIFAMLLGSIAGQNSHEVGFSFQETKAEGICGLTPFPRPNAHNKKSGKHSRNWELLTAHFISSP